MITFLVAFAAPYYRGADMAFVPQYRDLKAEFFVGSTKTDPIRALRDAGVNMLRLRVWVNPPDGYCGPARTIALAKEARDLGMEIMIDFHYSDTWADPQHQIPPVAWQRMSLDDMCLATEAHTFDVLTQLKQAGVHPKIVAIGNEVRDGMMWPKGQISKSGYGGFVSMLKAGINGARRAKMKPFQIMVHHDSGGDQKQCDTFFSKLTAERVSFDCIGLSYYPWWHGTMGALKGNMENLAVKFKKPIYVTETAYPFSTGWKDKTGNFVWEKTDLKSSHPATVEGQVAFLKELHKTVRSTPGGLGQGVLYWAPEYVAHPGIETPYENLALFDFENRLLPGARALGET